MLYYATLSQSNTESSINFSVTLGETKIPPNFIEIALRGSDAEIENLLPTPNEIERVIIEDVTQDELCVMQSGSSTITDNYMFKLTKFTEDEITAFIGCKMVYDMLSI